MIFWKKVIASEVDSRYILQVEQREFADVSDVGYTSGRRIKERSKIWAEQLGTWSCHWLRWRRSWEEQV